MRTRKPALDQRAPLAFGVTLQSAAFDQQGDSQTPMCKQLEPSEGAGQRDSQCEVSLLVRGANGFKQRVAAGPPSGQDLGATMLSHEA